MNITNVRIRKICEDGRLRAIVSIIVDGNFAIHDIKVIQGSDRLFVSMPSRKDGKGFQDIVHPVNPEVRVELERSILIVYNEYLSNKSSKGSED